MTVSANPTFDAHMMAIALRQAHRGLGRTAPNPSVGAVIADETTGEVIARGWTQPGGRPHAEKEALRRAGNRARGKTMYVTLEPCAHTGRVPTCSDAIVAAGIARVVCALPDPNPVVAGHGFAQLREAADHLVDIHGQHAWAALTRADEVRGLLDAYGKISSKDVSTAYHAWKAALKTLQDARAAQATLESERERLSWQIGELAKLAPQPQEWEALNAEHSTLANAAGLLEAAHLAIAALEGDESGVTTHLAKAQQLLQNQELLVPDFKALAEVLATSLAQVEDVVHSLHAYARNTEPDPQRLAQLDERLTQWISLARRYKRTPAQLADLLAGWKAELATNEAAADISALEAAQHKAHTLLLTQCSQLTAQRRKAAPQLGLAITQAMQGLGMQGGKFEVALLPLDEPAQYGQEGIEFLVAGHAGSTPRPVGKVASGGELSRIALAIAVTTSRLGKAQTLIFDEVDSGVGGAVAETVGRLMKQLGIDRQVMAVTHLPQVAACADHHLLVAKQLKGKHTSSDVRAIAGEQRVGEIARMLGGEKLLGTTLAHAKEMLGQRQ